MPANGSMSGCLRQGLASTATGRRQTTWPGEPAGEVVGDVGISDRDEDFATFVLAAVDKRRNAEAAFYASAAEDT